LIGLDVCRFERSLMRFLRLATQWAAIVLVDGADLYIQQRGPERTFEQVALISGKLSLLQNSFIGRLSQ
jgi:hypothetical protein